MRAEERLGKRQSKHDDQWNARFKELLSYRSEHGDCDVPTKQGQLGNWAHHQRTAYRAGSLAQDRIDRLNSIDFKWALEELVPWEIRFDQLVQYKAKHGDCNVPQRQGPLGKWVKNQKYRMSKLTQGRIDRLNAIGFEWTPQIGHSRKM